MYNKKKRERKGQATNPSNFLISKQPPLAILGGVQ